MATPQQEYERLRAKGLEHDQVMKRMSRANRRLVSQADRRQAAGDFKGNDFQAGDLATGRAPGSSGLDTSLPKTTTNQASAGSSTLTDTVLPQSTPGHGAVDPRAGVIEEGAYETKDIVIEVGDTPDKLMEKYGADPGIFGEELIPGTTATINVPKNAAPPFDPNDPFLTKMRRIGRSITGQSGEQFYDVVKEDFPQKPPAERFSNLNKILQSLGLVDPYKAVEGLSGKNQAPAYGGGGPRQPQDRDTLLNKAVDTFLSGMERVSDTGAVPTREAGRPRYPVSELGTLQAFRDKEFADAYTEREADFMRGTLGISDIKDKPGYYGVHGTEADLIDDRPVGGDYGLGTELEPGETGRPAPEDSIPANPYTTSGQNFQADPNLRPLPSHPSENPEIFAEMRARGENAGEAYRDAVAQWKADVTARYAEGKGQGAGRKAWADSRVINGNIADATWEQIDASFSDAEIYWMISQGILKMPEGSGGAVVQGPGGVKGFASGARRGGSGGGSGSGGFSGSGARPQQDRTGASLRLTSWSI